MKHEHDFKRLYKSSLQSIALLEGSLLAIGQNCLCCACATAQQVPFGLICVLLWWPASGDAPRLESGISQTAASTRCRCLSASGHAHWRTGASPARRALIHHKKSGQRRHGGSSVTLTLSYLCFSRLLFMMGHSKRPGWLGVVDGSTVSGRTAGAWHRNCVTVLQFSPPVLYGVSLIRCPKILRAKKTLLSCVSPEDWGKSLRFFPKTGKQLTFGWYLDVSSF